jgi:hypothetical protein
MAQVVNLMFDKSDEIEERERREETVKRKNKM